MAQEQRYQHCASERQWPRHADRAVALQPVASQLRRGGRQRLGYQCEYRRSRTGKRIPARTICGRSSLDATPNLVTSSMNSLMRETLNNPPGLLKKSDFMLAFVGPFLVSSLSTITPARWCAP